MQTHVCGVESRDQIRLLQMVFANVGGVVSLIFKEVAMETMGFMFGITGFIFALSAQGSARAAKNRVNDLIHRLDEAGILIDDKAPE